MRDIKLLNKKRLVLIESLLLCLMINQRVEIKIVLMKKRKKLCRVFLKLMMI